MRRTNCSRTVSIRAADLVPVAGVPVSAVQGRPKGYRIMRYWPRRADGLPPGQRLMTEMPRFTDRPHVPPPEMPVEPRLEITNEGEPIAVVTGADLQALEPRDHRADFHCVTTWSVTGLVWTGVPLREVFTSVGIIDAPAPYLVARAGDGDRVAFTWEDATADNVVLATHLNGAPLDARHARRCGSSRRANTATRA